MKQFLLICAFLGATCSFVLAQIASPGVFNTATINATEIATADSDAESNREPTFLSAISSSGNCGSSATCTPTYDLGLHWPKGTWYRGYADASISSTRWCRIEGGIYWGTHPLVRHSEVFGRAYMYLNRTDPKKYNFNRMIWAANYLSQDALQANGTLIFWRRRPSCTVPNPLSNTSTLPQNTADNYVMSRGLRQMTEAYWHLVEVNDVAASSYYQEIEYLANNLMSRTAVNNNNYRSFRAWALTNAYKVTGNERYFLFAKTLCESIMAAQTKTGLFAGTWRTGSLDAVGSQTVNHDTQIWYHQIIVRGLIETLSATPDLPEFATFRQNLHTSIELAVNHVINHRFNPNGNNLSRYYLDTQGNPIAAGSQEYLIHNIDWACMLAYYAISDPYYSGTDRTNLMYLMNRLAEGRAISDTKHLLNMATYLSYIDPVVHGVGTIDYRVQKDQEVLTNFSNTSNDLGLSHDGLNLPGSNVSSLGLGSIDKWIAGDFDGDGADELVYSYANNSTVYYAADASSLSASVIASSNPGGIDQWIVGDFDGNGEDELVYKFNGSTTLYKTSSPANLGNGLVIYQGALELDKWIALDYSGSFNNPVSDELLYKFTSSNQIYQSSGATNLTTTNPIYNGNQTLETWIAGDFDATKSISAYLGEELLYKFVGDNNIYASTGGTMALSQVFMVAGSIDLWDKGDFNGDMQDELIYKTVGSDTCRHVKNIFATAPTTTINYNGSYALENILIGDFDGDGDDEVLNKFKLLNKIYRSDDGLALGSQMLVYNGSGSLVNWIGLNVGGAEIASKSDIAPASSDQIRPQLWYKIAPNPASETCTVHLRNPAEGDVRIELFSLTGQRLWIREFINLAEGEQALTLQCTVRQNPLPNGMYLLKIKAHGMEETSRLMISN